MTFGEITCRKLTVVDDEGKRGVLLITDENGGVVIAYGKGEDGGYAQLYSDEHGGYVQARGKGNGYAHLGNDKYGTQTQLS